MKEILRITYAWPVPRFQKGEGGREGGRVATIDIAFVKVYLSIALLGVHLRRTSSAGGLTLSFQVIEAPPRHRALGQMSRRSHAERGREARSREKFQMQFYARTTRDLYVKRGSRLPSRSSRIILNAFNASTREFHRSRFPSLAAALFHEKIRFRDNLSFARDPLCR